MLIWQFSNLITYFRVVGKLLDWYFNVLLFSNAREKVLILVETRGKICLIVLLLYRTFSPGLTNNHTLKFWSDNFSTTRTYVVKLEYCRNNLSMNVVLQSKGIDSNSCFNFMKPGSQSATYSSLFLLTPPKFNPVVSVDWKCTLYTAHCKYQTILCPCWFFNSELIGPLCSALYMHIYYTQGTPRTLPYINRPNLSSDCSHISRPGYLILCWILVVGI